MTTTPTPGRTRVQLQSTMQETQLSIATIVRYGTTVYGGQELITYDGERTSRASFAEVGTRAAQLAHGLADVLGVEIGEPVATLMWNIREHFECYLAVPAMGAVLHTLNVRYTPEQIAYTSRHAGDRVLVVDASLVATLRDLLPQMPTVEHVVVVGGPEDAAGLDGCGVTVHRYDELTAGRPTTYDWPELPETSAALMCYTSGTTGDPKGVVYSHRSVYLVSMQLCMGDYLALSVADKGLVIVPMFHANSWNLPFAALMVGTSMVLPGRYVQPEHLARLIQQERPTVSAGVPTIWSDMLAYARKHGTDLSSLRDVVVGGSVCPRSLMEAYEKEFGVRLLHGWGMTEMSPIGTIAKPDGIADPHAAWALRLTQGRFVCGTQARIVGPDDEVLPRDGEAMGEVETRGPWITGAYHRQPDGSRFHDGWLRTGDVGTISPEGVLHLRDRTKDVIKSGGEWISSMELEEALADDPAVAEAAVIGVEDERWGERPLAIVSLVEGADDSDPAVLARHLAGRVSRWQVPERWSRVPELPRTSVGKIDKAALRRRYAEQGLDVEFVQIPPSGSTSS
ncbi:long-chain fatty acid--CoA ligase [Blastococcus sp. SYSU DS0533]